MIDAFRHSLSWRILTLTYFSITNNITPAIIIIVMNKKIPCLNSFRHTCRQLIIMVPLKLFPTPYYCTKLGENMFELGL